MKKKTLLVTITASVLVVGSLAGVAIAKTASGKYFSATQADNYTLNAFDAFLDNPGASVTMHTTLGNSIVLSTSGAAVNGNKITLAPGGYLEVARDEGKEELNAVDGLTSIVTDFEGRIAYSYRDKVATYDDAVDGTYTFSAEHAPSFFKLYNDSTETREITSFQIKYDCAASENSIATAHKTYTVSDGIVSTAEDNVTFSLIQETKKGVLSFKAKNSAGGTKYVGAAIGITTTKPNDWYYTGTSYVYAHINGNGNATLATVNKASGTDLIGIDGRSMHTVPNFVLGEYVDFTVNFDVDNQYYALYCNGYTMAVDTTPVATGSMLGFRINNQGDSIKDIVLQKNIDFRHDPLQARAQKQYNVYYDGTSNVYESIVTEKDAYHYFQEELPTTGTITFDYSNLSGPTNWVEGLIFTDAIGYKSINDGKMAIFGASGAYQNFNGVVCYNYVDPDTSEASVKTAWMNTRDGKFSYPVDGSVLHMKFEYNLSIPSWTCYTRDTVDGEWTKTGETGTGEFIESSKDLTGLKYLGIRNALYHKDDAWQMRITNLVVNGVAY